MFTKMYVVVKYSNKYNVNIIVLIYFSNFNFNIHSC